MGKIILYNIEPHFFKQHTFSQGSLHPHFPQSNNYGSRFKKTLGYTSMDVDHVVCKYIFGIVMNQLISTFNTYVHFHLANKWLVGISFLQWNCQWSLWLNLEVKILQSPH